MAAPVPHLRTDVMAAHPTADTSPSHTQAVPAHVRACDPLPYAQTHTKKVAALRSAPVQFAAVHTDAGARAMGVGAA
eukprot:358030-Chlamydomonas_euryale.AAC.3